MELEEKKSNILQLHNYYRENHLCEKLEWDEALAYRAQAWADTLAKQNTVVHDINTDDGENIIIIVGASLTYKMIVNTWYDEIRKYDFDNHRYDFYTAHFTQLVWRKSLKFGYGEATSTSNVTYAVARYYPAGNVEGQYGDNITPPTLGLVVRSCPIGMKGVGEDACMLLSKHNELRNMHGSEPLRYSQELSELARELMLKHVEDVTWDGNSEDEYGINICRLINSEPVEETLVQCWYDEIEKYSFEHSVITDETKHFTQIVWKDTRELGMAKLQHDANRWILVVLYYPKGNVASLVRENVLMMKIDPDEIEEEDLSSLPEDKEFETTPMDHSDHEKKPSSDSSHSKATMNPKEDFLNTHNQLRLNHHAKPLEFLEELEADAKVWAEELAGRNIIKYDKTTLQGENIGWDLSGRENLHNLVMSWYNQQRYYDYTTPNTSSECRNFIQIVWKETKYVGYAAATSKTGVIYYVARYWPPGNISGNYKQNVLENAYLSVISQNEYEKYQNSVLDFHNKRRRRHKARALSLSNQLSAAANEMAANLMTLGFEGNKFGAMANYTYPCNYLISRGIELPKAEAVCTMWYNTSLNYSHDRNVITLQTAPFCQMVWKATMSIGVGIAKNNEFNIILVLYDERTDGYQNVDKNVVPTAHRYPTSMVREKITSKKSDD